MPVIKRVLSGTSFIATLGLSESQYQHFRVAEGRRPDPPTPMNPAIMREMLLLANHFRELSALEMASLVADEVRDAMEMVGDG